MIKYIPDDGVQQRIDRLMSKLGLRGRVVGVRSRGSKSRHILARVWSCPKIWQVALGMLPVYIIEVITRRWDRLPEKEKDDIIVHELSHLPKKFTGGLVNHNKHFKKKLKKNLKDINDQL